MSEKKLSTSQKLSYGIFDLGGNMLFTIMGFWCLNYLTDTIGLAAGLAGFAIMIGKLWDAVTDPVMGFISDRTKSRWGRRRPYLLFGALPMLAAFWFFFTPPSIAVSNQIAITVWAALALMLVNTASTIINIPYSSMTPELTNDYHERTTLNGYRFGCAVFGTIIGAAAVQPITGLFGDLRTGFSMLGLILGCIIAIVTLLTFFGTGKIAPVTTPIPNKGFFETYKDVFKNKPYLILLFTYCLNLMGINFLQTILVYYTKYIYNNEGMTTFAMLILLLTAMIFIPVSVLVSKKIGKKRTYQICFIIIATTCGAIFCLGEIIGTSFFYGAMVFGGIGVGFGYVAPFAMVPDAIEYDAIKTGERKEGAYYGMWTFIAKTGQAITLFLTGIILSAGGFVENAIQSESAKTAIKIIIGPIPIAILVCATILIHFYPLDEKAYNEMMAEKQH